VRKRIAAHPVPRAPHCHFSGKASWCRTTAMRFVTVDNVRCWLCREHYQAFERCQLEVVITQERIVLRDIHQTVGFKPSRLQSLRNAIALRT